MSIIRCPKGHFYDNEKYDFCPTCSKSSGSRWQLDNEKTVSLDMLGGGMEEIRLTAEEPVKQHVQGNWDSEKTVAYTEYDAPGLLTGWLVCVAGSMKGKDYRVYSGFNRIGRNLDSDIVIQDPSVAGTMHCAVVYDEKGECFYLVPGKGTNTYLNQEVLQMAVELHERDRIEIGGSVLEFVPFCKGERTWKTIQTF